MAISHAMTAAHLLKFQAKYDVGIPYHFTQPEKVKELVELVTKVAVPLDYDMPSCGTAYLRMNTIVKEYPNKESWMYGGGALTTPDVQAQIDAAIARSLELTPEKELKSYDLTAYILNEWERFSVVFELVITIGAKQ